MRSPSETPVVPERAKTSDERWFAVKCLFSHPTRARDGDQNLYEERTTLWRASSWEEAFKCAEGEAQEYAKAENCIFHFATDAFLLADGSVRNGSEIWSQMRGSGMDPETYEQTFCATPRDRMS